MAKKKTAPKPKSAKTKTASSAKPAVKKTIAPAAVPSSLHLIKQSLHIFRRFWKPLLGVLLIYILLNIFFASGISDITGTVSSIKADLNSTSPHAHPLLSATAGFLLLVSSAGSSSNSIGGLLQSLLIIIQSLVVIWMLRHLLAGKSAGIKEAYYNAMAPLVPFLLIIAVIFIQLLPITLGSTALAAIASSLGTISGLWSVIFSLILLGLVAWSFYMLSSSIFALYIVTLPHMQPRNALQSARNLVRFRRWPVLRRVFFLPLFLMAVMGLLIIPLILYATALVTPVFYVLIAAALIFAHSYLYNLYRGLLG